jgi:hypothetical protein
VIEVRRHGIDSTSEIDVMGKIEIFYFAKGTGSIQLEYKTGLITELIPDLLDDLLDFSCLLVVSFSFQFYCILVNKF